MKGFTYRVASLALIVGLLLSACGTTGRMPSAPTSPSSPQPAPAPQLSEWDSVLAAASKEGAVTIYSTSANQLLEASKAAMSRYGIKVETIGGDAGALELKIVSEQRAKVYTADLYTTGWTNIGNLIKGGQTQTISVSLPSLSDRVSWKLDPSRFEPTKSGFVYGTGLTPSIIINTDLVKQGEIQSWQDVLDPKWKDKMVMMDPRSTSGPGPIGIWAWSTLGEDFWKKLAAQRPSLQSNPELPVQQVAYGERHVAIFPNYLRISPAIKAGAPIQIVHLKEGTSYYVSGVVFIKNAPHPNAAQVFLNWMFSKEGQAAIGRSAGIYTIRKDVADDWITIKEFRPENYTLLEPPNNLDPQNGPRGGEFGKKIFGSQ